jgi:hypothetical protein
MSEIEEAIVAEATKGGWKPKEEWSGDPDTWRSAEDFVERGNTILPIVKKRMNKEIEDLRKELSTQSKYQSSQLDKIIKQADDNAKKVYEAKLEALDKQELEAVEDGNTKEFKRVKAEKEKLEVPVDEPVNKNDPVFDAWKKDNDWYETDDAATDLAMGYAARLKDKKPDMPQDEFYDAVGTFVKTEMAHKFKNPNREKAGDVEGGGHDEGTGKKNSYNDLPANAKAAFKADEIKFKEKGFEIDKKEWVKTYFEED